MSDCKSPVCSCHGEPDNHASFNSMLNLAAAVITQAINDAAMTQEMFEGRMKREGKHNHGLITYSKWVWDAKQFIYDVWGHKRDLIKQIEAYWASPYCKKCGKEVSWPREWCFRCGSPKEREERKYQKHQREWERKKARREHGDS